jgi:hypothetical protein
MMESGPELRPDFSAKEFPAKENTLSVTKGCSGDTNLYCGWDLTATPVYAQLHQS